MANAGTTSGKIRCVVCGAPANSLTDVDQLCISHAAERRPEDGGWAQFGLRDRILLPTSRRMRRPPTRQATTG